MRESRRNITGRANAYAQNRPYIEGTAVRKLDALPQRRPKLESPEPKKQQSREVYKNREKVMAMDAQFVLILVIACAILFLVFGEYLYFKAGVVNSTKRIARYESQLLEISKDNRVASNDLKNKVDLKRIYSKATKELHMIVPGKSNVKYYEPREVEYTKGIK